VPGTSFYNADDKSFPSVLVPLPATTSDPVVLATAGQRLVPLLAEGVKCVRAGIMLTSSPPPTGRRYLSRSVSHMKTKASAPSSRK